MIDLITVLSPHLTPPVVSQILLPEVQTPPPYTWWEFGWGPQSGVGCPVRRFLLRDSPSQLSNVVLMPIVLHPPISVFFLYVSAVLLYGLCIIFFFCGTKYTHSYIHSLISEWRLAGSVFKNIFSCGHLSEAILSPCPPTIFLRQCVCAFTLSRFFQPPLSSGLSTPWWRCLGSPACWEP